MLGDVNKLFVFKRWLNHPSNDLPSNLKLTFSPIIWIFTEVEGDVIKSRLPFKQLSRYFIIRGDWVFSYLVWFWFWLVVLILVHPAPHLIWLFGLHLVPFFGGLAVWRTLFCVWLECGLFLFVATPTRWQHWFMVTWHLMFPIVHRATVPKSGTFAHTSGFVLVLLLLFYLVLKWVDKK